MKPRARSEADVEILEKTEAYRGYFRVDRYRLRHRLHDGSWSAPITREVFERGHAAAVLPYDPKLDSVVLIEQFRIGAFAAGRPPWLLEIAAGIIEAGENAEQVVRREVQEEAGCEVGELVKVADYLVSPGGTSECVTIFCGRVDASNAGGIHGKAEEHEDIRVVVAPFAEAKQRLDQGAIDNAAALIALQWLALHRDELRARWLAGQAGTPVP
ncbi:MAG: ADP-ribose diphosphatase [Alphaproteobacteria bacterium]